MSSIAKASQAETGQHRLLLTASLFDSLALSLSLDLSIGAAEGPETFCLVVSRFTHS